jgi:hypothetical protein
MRKVIKKKSKIGMALNSPVSRYLTAMLAAETRRRCKNWPAGLYYLKLYEGTHLKVVDKLIIVN